jgi:hypothetical protein
MPHRPDRQDQRRIERRDHADDTDRHAPREAEVRLGGPQDLAKRERRQTRGLVAGVLGEAGLQGTPGGNAAPLADDPSVDLLGVPRPEIARLAQHPGPRLIRHGGPGALRLRGPLGGAPHVGRAGDAEPTELATGRRLDHRALAASAGAPSVDKDLSGPRLRLEKVHGTSPLSCDGARAHREASQARPELDAAPTSLSRRPAPCQHPEQLA